MSYPKFIYLVHQVCNVIQNRKNKVPKETPRVPKILAIFGSFQKCPKISFFGGILCRGGMALINIVRLSKLLKIWTNERCFITYPLKVKFKKLLGLISPHYFTTLLNIIWSFDLFHFLSLNLFFCFIGFRNTNGVKRVQIERGWVGFFYIFFTKSSHFRSVFCFLIQILTYIGI